MITGSLDNTHGSMRNARRGVTLIEILTAVSIIVVLAALVIGIGSTMVKGQASKQTEGLLTTLDRVLEEFVLATGTVPKYTASDYDGAPGPGNATERYGGAEQSRYPDVSVFFAQVRGVGEADSIIKAIDPQFLTLTPTTGDAADDFRAQQPSVIDSWGVDNWDSICPPSDPWCVDQQQLVFYVHPDNTLAQALFGRCVNGRPFFVSAGPDLLYGLPEELDAISSTYEIGQEGGESQTDYVQRALRTARADNIYSYKVDSTFLVPDSLLP